MLLTWNLLQRFLISENVQDCCLKKNGVYFSDVTLKWMDQRYQVISVRLTIVNCDEVSLNDQIGIISVLFSY